MVERRHQHEHRYRRLHRHDNDDNHNDYGSEHDINHHPACVYVHHNHDGPCHDHDGTLLNVDNQQRAIHDNDDRTDHDIAFDDHTNHLVTSREQHDNCAALDDAIHDYAIESYDIDRIALDEPLYLAAVQSVYDAAARVLGTDGATDKPDDDDAMRAYLTARAEFDTGTRGESFYFTAVRDAARAYLAANGG